MRGQTETTCLQVLTPLTACRADDTQGCVLRSGIRIFRERQASGLKLLQQNLRPNRKNSIEVDTWVRGEARRGIGPLQGL